MLYFQNCQSFLFRTYSFASQPATIPRSSLILLTSLPPSPASAGRTTFLLCDHPPTLTQTSLITYVTRKLLLGYFVSSPGTPAPCGQALSFTYLYFRHLIHSPVENTLHMKNTTLSPVSFLWLLWHPLITHFQVCDLDQLFKFQKSQFHFLCRGDIIST